MTKKSTNSALQVSYFQERTLTYFDLYGTETLYYRYLQQNSHYRVRFRRVTKESIFCI